MFRFSLILTDLRAVIAAAAARDRSLTVLLVALYARIARMGARLERLIALWRAGKLPKPRVTPAPTGKPAAAPRASPRIRFPTAPGWLRRKLGYAVGAHGSQLQHLLTDAECVEFLAACPQAGRILRPLLRMLTFDPPPAALRKRPQLMPAPIAAVARVGMVAPPAAHFLDA